MNTIAVWRRRFADFPLPCLVLSGTFIWRRSAILEWAVDHGRETA